MLLLGAVTACPHRSDPRLEPLSAMPVSPAMAFATGLARVLGIDLVLALVASGVLVAVGAATGLAAVVAGRLGRALLATSAGVVVAIWRSPAFGTTAGAAVWLFGRLPGPAVPYRPVPACGCPGARVAARPGGLAGPPAAAVRRGRLTRASGLRGERPVGADRSLCRRARYGRARHEFRHGARVITGGEVPYRRLEPRHRLRREPPRHHPPRHLMLRRVE